MAHTHAGMADDVVHVGSKTFTESVVLGELVSVVGRNTGTLVEHRRELGGTRVLFSALTGGDIDAYVEYTGTITQEIYATRNITTNAEIRRELAKDNISMTAPLGFNNTYAIGMKESRAAELGIETVSDLREHTDLILGFGNEFMDRGDGWPRLRDHYELPHENVKGLDHDLAYRAIDKGSIDVMDLYATDAEIEYYNLRVLEDDRELFPEYNAVVIYRNDLQERAPEVIDAFERLEGAIPESTMIAMNAKVKLEGIGESRVAVDFARREFGITANVTESRMVDRLWRNGLEHIRLVAISLTGAILLALPLGILAHRYVRWGQIILGAVGIIQTIPALALLVFMIPPLGIGGPAAIAALFLYSLLPIVRNTHAGLAEIPLTLRESAAALGLPPRARLMKIELPMAAGAVLAGVKTAVVINIGTATLGALIGAGGYGQPILTGIRLDDIGLILEGAVPAAVLALMAQAFFEFLDKIIVPKGLRIKPDTS
ncbi:MAG: ABC transporter permease subunit [candidate division Zixibacteria bacterium]|nr:ABC transporter permease subunit [candidate division Zixibacteria bacterium]